MVPPLWVTWDFMQFKTTAIPCWAGKRLWGTVTPASLGIPSTIDAVMLSHRKLSSRSPWDSVPFSFEKRSLISYNIFYSCYFRRSAEDLSEHRRSLPGQNRNMSHSINPWNVPSARRKNTTMTFCRAVSKREGEEEAHTAGEHKCTPTQVAATKRRNPLQGLIERSKMKCQAWVVLNFIKTKEFHYSTSNKGKLLCYNHVHKLSQVGKGLSFMSIKW